MLVFRDSASSCFRFLRSLTFHAHEAKLFLLAKRVPWESKENISGSTTISRTQRKSTNDCEYFAISQEALSFVMLNEISRVEEKREEKILQICSANEKSIFWVLLMVGTLLNCRVINTFVEYLVCGRKQLKFQS